MTNLFRSSCSQNYGCCCQSSSVSHGVCPCNQIHHLEVLLCFPAFISWLIGGIAVGFVCPQLEKMHSGKASPLTCSGSRTSLWFSYHRHIEAFGATVALPRCVKSSSNPRHPVSGATRHHMHCCYPLHLRHHMAFHNRPRPPIHPWLANLFLCLGQCLLDWCMYSFWIWLLLSMMPMSLTKRERTLHFDASRITHNW